MGRRWDEMGEDRKVKDRTEWEGVKHDGIGREGIRAEGRGRDGMGSVCEWRWGGKESRWERRWGMVHATPVFVPS